MMKYEKLYTSSNIILKGLSFLLEESDINYIIKDRFESARLAGFGETRYATEIHVDIKKLKVAKEILEKYKISINSEK